MNSGTLNKLKFNKFKEEEKVISQNIYHLEPWEAAWWIRSKEDESKIWSTARLTRCWIEELHRSSAMVKEFCQETTAIHL